jgi:phosphoglycolate phosphatase
MTQAPAQAALFDLDGTLLDTLDDLADSANAALAALGFAPHPVDDYRHLVGDGARVLFQRALRGRPGECAEAVDACLAQFKIEYGTRWHNKTRIYPGIPELLDRLHAGGLPLAVLSNKPDAFTRECVARFLPGWPWAAVVGQSESTPCKPDPAGALAIAAGLGIEPAGFLYFGDTATDMHTAHAAGMLPLGCLWGFRDAAELSGAGAARLLASPDDWA